MGRNNDIAALPNSSAMQTRKLRSRPAPAPNPPRGKKRMASEVVDLTADEPSVEPPRKFRKKAPNAEVKGVEYEPKKRVAAPKTTVPKTTVPKTTTPKTTVPKSTAPKDALKDSPKKARKDSKGSRQDSDDEKKVLEEKRLKRFRPKCPTNVVDRLHRARNQRMYVLKRERDDLASPRNETFDIAGSTGNIYTVTISLVPGCNCPDGQKNGTCKHILYVMTKVLKAREDLVYQAALLTTELDEIFQASPVLSAGSGPGDLRPRKPLDEDECPICYEDFEGDAGNAVYCKAQCGTNMHKACFQQWAASKKGATVTCVMCRTPWQYDTQSANLQNFVSSAKVGEDGYRNIGSEARAQLGISGRRDESTYNQFWLSRKYGYGHYY